MLGPSAADKNSAGGFAIISSCFKLWALLKGNYDPQTDMETHMSHSLNSLKGSYIGDYIGTTIGDTKGDTRSLDYGSYSPLACTRTVISIGPFWGFHVSFRECTVLLIGFRVLC